MTATLMLVERPIVQSEQGIKLKEDIRTTPEKQCGYISLR